MLRRLSVHAAGLKEPDEKYVWETLKAPTFEEGAAKGFNHITQALREYALAGVLHFEHFASIRNSAQYDLLKRRATNELARALGQQSNEIAGGLDRLLQNHAKEWSVFTNDLGPESVCEKMDWYGIMTSPIEKISPAELGARLKVAREAANVTQDTGAKAAGIARTTLVAIEKGQRSVRIDELQALSRCYDVSANSLLRRESVHVDLVPRFRSLPETGDVGIDQAARTLNDLVRAEVELENILGAQRTHRYPAEKTILPGDVRSQAEQDAQNLRNWLGLGEGPVQNLFAIMELQLGVRVYSRQLDSKVSGLFAYDDAVGACMLINSSHRKDRRDSDGRSRTRTLHGDTPTAGDLSRRKIRQFSGRALCKCVRTGFLDACAHRDGKIQGVDGGVESSDAPSCDSSRKFFWSLASSRGHAA